MSNTTDWIVIFSACAGFVVFMAFAWRHLFDWQFRGSNREPIRGIPVCECATMAQADRAVADLLKTKPTVVGIDVEFAEPAGTDNNSGKAGKREKAKTLRICSRERMVVVRLNRIESTPHALRKFLGDHRVLKAAVHVERMAARLRDGYRLRLLGTVELNHLLGSINWRAYLERTELHARCRITAESARILVGKTHAKQQKLRKFEYLTLEEMAGLICNCVRVSAADSAIFALDAFVILLNTKDLLEGREPEHPFPATQRAE